MKSDNENTSPLPPHTPNHDMNFQETGYTNQMLGIIYEKSESIKGNRLGMNQT